MARYCNSDSQTLLAWASLLHRTGTSKPRSLPKVRRIQGSPGGAIRRLVSIEPQRCVVCLKDALVPRVVLLGTPHVAKGGLVFVLVAIIRVEIPLHVIILLLDHLETHLRKDRSQGVNGPRYHVILTLVRRGASRFDVLRVPRLWLEAVKHRNTEGAAWLHEREGIGSDSLHLHRGEMLQDVLRKEVVRAHPFQCVEPSSGEEEIETTPVAADPIFLN